MLAFKHHIVCWKFWRLFFVTLSHHYYMLFWVVCMVNSWNQRAGVGCEEDKNPWAETHQIQGTLGKLVVFTEKHAWVQLKKDECIISHWIKRIQCRKRKTSYVSIKTPQNALKRNISLCLYLCKSMKNRENLEMSGIGEKSFSLNDGTVVHRLKLGSGGEEGRSDKALGRHHDRCWLFLCIE